MQIIFTDPVSLMEFTAAVGTLLYVLVLTFQQLFFSSGSAAADEGFKDAPQNIRTARIKYHRDSELLSECRDIAQHVLQMFKVGTLISLPKRSLRYQRLC